MIEFPSAISSSEIARVARLADEIWREHYPAIIGMDQVDYMLDHFQTATSIAEQIAGQGYHYHLIHLDDQDLGYLAFASHEDGLFLSKIYLLAQSRGMGLGRAAFDFLREEAVRMGLDKIWLTVNRHNQLAIRAYERWGFLSVGEVTQDIGNGFVMDDYKMELSLI